MNFCTFLVLCVKDNFELNKTYLYYQKKKKIVSVNRKGAKQLRNASAKPEGAKQSNNHAEIAPMDMKRHARVVSHDLLKSLNFKQPNKYRKEIQF